MTLAGKVKSICSPLSVTVIQLKLVPENQVISTSDTNIKMKKTNRYCRRLMYFNIV